MRDKPARKPSKPSVKAAAPKKIAVSVGVKTLGGMTPQYPATAKAARSKPVISKGKAVKGTAIAKVKEKA